MGSFNTTCFASGQTIAPDDRCFVTPLLQSKSYEPVEMTYGDQALSAFGICRSTCYPTAFWTPFSGSLEATYSDYGSFTLLDTPCNRKFLLEFLVRLMYDSPAVVQGSNSSHDLPFDLPAFAAQNAPFLQTAAVHWNKVQPEVTGEAFKELLAVWEYVWEVAREQRLFLVDDSYARPVQFAVMHAVAHDKLIAAAEAHASRDDEPMDRRSVFDRALATSTLEKAAARYERAAKDPDENRRLSMLNFFRADMFREAFRVGESSGHNYVDQGALSKDFLKSCAGELSEDELFERILPGLSSRYVLSELENLNIRFSPMVYAGQDYDNSIGGAYSDFVQGVRQAVDTQRREYYNEVEYNEDEESDGAN